MFELIFFASFAVFFSFMCSLFEAALYSVPIGHIESLAKTGSVSGRLLKKFRENVDAPIAGILSLNTIAHTGGAAFAGAAAAEVLGEPWLPHFSVVFTLVILLFSEIIPKTVGVVYARQLVSLIAYPIQFLIWIQAPLIWLCQFVTRLISPEKVETCRISRGTHSTGKYGTPCGNHRCRRKQRHSEYSIVKRENRSGNHDTAHGH